MSQAEIEALLTLIGLVTFGAFGLTAYKWRLQAKGILGGGRSTERLAESVTELREQMAAMREDIVELHERVDFAERVISHGDRQQALPGEGSP